MGPGRHVLALARLGVMALGVDISSFGLTIDPGDVGEVALPVTAAIVLSVVLNIAAGIVGARMHGFGQRAAANAGLTLLGRGEFSLILVALATAAGLDRRLGPFVALYVLVLAIAGPLVASRSRILANRLPARIFARKVN
jgi:monovalent cation:H+ antiporter-2, CPA2 family